MRNVRGDRSERQLRDRVISLPLRWAGPLLALAAGILLLVSGAWPLGDRASTASAADQARPAGHPGGPVNFSTEDPRATERDLRETREAAERRQARLATPRSREERTRSRTAYHGVDTVEALRVARRTQPEVAVQPLWRGPAVGEDERIVAYDSPISALVATEGSKVRSRVEAIGAPFAVGPKPGAPAAAKDLDAVDLTLKDDDGRWTPSRPAVATTLPRDTHEPVTVGDELSLDLRQSTERQPSAGAPTAETKVFYGGIAADTDAMVEPVADGVSLSWLLRSPAAPSRLRYHVEGGTPKDGRVEPDGSLILRDGDREVGTVSAPRAFDGQDTAVETRFVVEGDDVWVEVDHRDRDLAYPIAVDPVIRPSGGLAAVLEQDDTGTPAPGPMRSGWVPHSFQPAAFQFQEFGTSRSITATRQGQGSGWFSFNPIRNSAPYKVQYTDVRLTQPNPAVLDACQNVGIYTEVAPNTAGPATAKHSYWLGSYAQGGATPWNGATPPAPTGQGTGTYSNCTAARPAAFVEICAANDCNPVGAIDNATAMQLNVGGGAAASASFTGAYVFHRENVAPTVTLTPDWNPAVWSAFAQGATLKAQVHDDGVGLCGDAANGFPAVVTLVDLLATSQLAQARNAGCTGMTYDRPAPADYTYDLTVPGPSLPEGIRLLNAATVDAVGNKTNATTGARVDRSAPTVTVSGDLYAQRATSMPIGGQRALTVGATDGAGTNTNTARAGVQRIRIFVDDDLVKTEEQTATGDSKPLSLNWTPPADTFGSGDHVVRVVVTDRAGNEKTEQFAVKVGAPQPPRSAEPGLGFENWQTYDSMPTGAGSVHRVNLATGNSLWSVTPVSNPGIGFDTSLRLTYNSLEPSALRPDLAAYKPFAYGVAGRGVSVQLGSVTRLNEPLWIENRDGNPSSFGSSSNVGRVVLTDGDGTRHVFTRDADAGGVRFKAPPGVHLELRRFENVASSPHYWAATRPDGSTFFFTRDGRPSEAQERHGNTLRLNWEERPDYATSPTTPGCGYAPACRYRVKEVVDAAALDATGLTGSNHTPDERKWTLLYDTANPMRLVGVDDRKRVNNGSGTVRRRTSLAYDADGRLTSVTVAANAANGAARRTWGLGYVSGTSFLERVTDPVGNATRIRYTAAQGPSTPLAGLLDPLLGFAATAPETRRVVGVADRESTVSNGVESRERVFRYGAPVAAGAGFAMATWVRDARNVSSRYSMDHRGRLTRLIEDLDDDTRSDDALPSGGASSAYLQRGTAQTWNDDVNAVASVTRGIRGLDPVFDTSQATTTEYAWGSLGQLQQETEHKGVAGASPGGADERTRSWTYNMHNGTVEGEGDGGKSFVYDKATETDRRGKTTTYAYDDEKGDPRQVNEPGGAEQDFRYNARGLVVEHSVRQWAGSDNGDDSGKPSWARGDAGTPGDPSEKTFVTDTFGDFDGNGDAWVRVDARGKSWRTIHDETGNAVLVGDPRAGILSGARGMEVLIANAADPVTAFDGSIRTLARSASGAQAYVARYTFDTLDRQVVVAMPKRSAATKPGTTSTVDDRFVVTATTYDANDNVKAERDAESQITSRTFTKTDQLSAEQEPAAPQHAEPGPGDPEAWGNGAERAPVTKFAYDENDNLTVRKDPVPNGDEPIGAVGYRKRWTFDRLDRSVLQVEEGTSAAAPELKLTSRAYDLRDNVVAEIDPRTNGVTAEATTITNAAAGQGLRFRYEYDPFDRLVRQTENPRGDEIRATDPTDQNRVTRWSYDAEDNQVGTTTPRQRYTRRTYDDRGDLVRIDEPFDFISGPGNDGSTDSEATTTITRRLDGRPSQIVSPRGNDDDDPVNDGSSFRTRFKYFDTGELRTRWLPRVKDQYGPSSWQVRYDINDVGDPVHIRDARGNLFDNTFVDTGELATTTRPSWWIYDQDSTSIRERTSDDPSPADASMGSGGLPSEPGNGDFGKVQPQALPDVMPAAGDTAVTYNDRLQPTTVKGQGDAPDAATISQTLDYDRLGRLTRRELPMRDSTAAGSTVELAWQYDVRGLPRAARRLRQSADGGSATTFWNYDGFGREVKTTAPPSCQGSGCLPPVSTTAYDRNDAVTDEVLPAHDEAVQGRVGTTTGTRHHTIDRADRRVATDDETGAHTETVYDLDDLVSKRYGARAFVSDEGGAGSASAKEQYATNYRYDGAGRVTRQTSKVTDADGTRDLVTTTKYDREGNPVRTDSPGARNSETDSGEIAQRTTSRVYDARGLLWKRTIGAGDNAVTTITEYDGEGNLRRTVNPKGVTGTGSGATPTHPDEGASGLTAHSAWHATVQNYDADQGLVGRTMPWDDDDKGPSDAERHRYRQVFERGKRGLVTRITGIYDAKDGSGDPTSDTQIERNLVGWPTRSTDRRLAGSSWTTVGAPLKYDYDQLGNQTEWSSVGGSRTIQRSFYRSGQLRVKCGRRTAGGSQEQVYSYRYSRSGALTAVVDWMHHSAPSADPERCQPEEDDDKGILDPRKTVVERDRADRPTLVNETWTGGKDTAIRYFGSVPNLVKSVQTDGKVTGNDGNDYAGGKSAAYSYDQQGRNTQVRVRDDGDLSGTPDRTTDMAWWPSNERRSTKKPKTSDDKRTVDSRFYNSRGETVRRRADPATGTTKTYVYEYDKNGNRTKDERGTSKYNARDQLTEWTRIRRTANGDAIPEATDAQGYVAPTEKSPAKTTKYTRIDGAGRPEKIEETIKSPQPGIGLVETTIKTENDYEGDQLAKALRTTKAVPPSGANAVQSTSAQTDCFDYDVFGSQTQTYRQTTTKDGASPGQNVDPPTPASSCKSDAGAWSGVVENRNVFDTFERQNASRQRSHGKVDESDGGALNGTQAFCYDPLDRRDRRVVGLTGATDPAASEDEDDGRTRAQTACTTPAKQIGDDVEAYDYSYVGLTEQLSREIRAGREQTYDYTASGERLGRLKGTGSSKEWRAYDTDAQGSVVGLEKPTTGETTPDADGKLNTYETDPFGDPVGKESDVSDEASENPFRFQGFYSDPGTGTYDMQARAYQPSTGRFLQQDRFEDPTADLTLAADPMTSSRYAFTAGNPGTRSEYDGHAGPPAGEGCAPTPSGVRCQPTPPSQKPSKKDVPGCGGNGCKVDPMPNGAGSNVRDNATARTTPVYNVAPGSGAAPSVGATNAVRVAQAAAASSGGSAYAYRQAGSGDVAYACTGAIGQPCFRATSGSEAVDDGGTEGVHAALDAAGVIDPFGIADSANALAYLAEGRVGDALISAAGVVPYAGDTAKAGRYARRLCSFGGATLVSMGDGSLRPISEVSVGDIVVTTDPKSGKRHKRRVSHAWMHADRVYLLDVAGEELVATEDHPFWDASHRRWVEAGDLSSADRLLSAGGRRETTRGMGRYVGVRRAYNLTVEGEHTYHVGRGRVLVHNSCPVGGGAGPVRVGQRGEAAVRMQLDIGPKVPFTVNGRRRIADGMNGDALTEVKNVSYQHYSRQLRDSAQEARRRNLTFDLYTRSDTRLSRPLQRRIVAGEIRLRRIPGS